MTYDNCMGIATNENMVIIAELLSALVGTGSFDGPWWSLLPLGVIFITINLITLIE